MAAGSRKVLRFVTLLGHESTCDLPSCRRYRSALSQISDADPLGLHVTWEECLKDRDCHLLIRAPGRIWIHFRYAWNGTKRMRTRKADEVLNLEAADFFDWSQSYSYVPSDEGVDPESHPDAPLWRPRYGMPMELLEDMQERPYYEHVSLYGPLDAPTVLGRQKEKLTLEAYRVVRSLIEAGQAGISYADLGTVSKVASARNIIARLRKDPDWAAVIECPGAARKGPFYIRGGVVHPDLIRV